MSNFWQQVAVNAGYKAPTMAYQQDLKQQQSLAEMDYAAQIKQQAQKRMLQQQMAMAQQIAPDASPAQLMALAQKPDLLAEHTARNMGLQIDANKVTMDAYGNPISVSPSGQGFPITGEGIQRYERTAGVGGGSPQRTTSPTPAVGTTPVERQGGSLIADRISEVEEAIRQKTESLYNIAPRDSSALAATQQQLEYLNRVRGELVKRAELEEGREYNEDKYVKEVAVPNYKVAEGFRPPPKAADTLRKVVLSKERADALLDGLKKTIQEKGAILSAPVIGNPRQAETLQFYNESRAKLDLVGKELEELGALQGPDLQLLQRMMADPTEVKFQLLDDERAKQIMINSVENYRKYMQEKIDAQAETYGYVPSGGKNENVKDVGNAQTNAISWDEM